MKKKHTFHITILSATLLMYNSYLLILEDEKLKRKVYPILSELAQYK